ncbi:Holliday junction resolvase RuvX [Candidatus Steffania adelgidicola]|uniref:Holliday junction resolvase RuvX n=1 Tax=Candidatus Steffania adelgidicola TaxID=1076626 RepID=UPI001D02D770|nr:Holliday junction resolvase RuvX [Candidatus Steffania adelgidicola]UDG79986.1 Putative pre-16S rRNA nuclease [Candidatus Steffania adelgidicola]
MIASGSIMAFDFGTKNIGISIGQRVTFTARPLMTLKAKNGVPNWQQIQRLFDEWHPDIVVVGLPLTMNGSEQPITARVRTFSNRLHGHFGIQVVLHDERLSTVEARVRLFERGGYRALMKSKIDAYSAVIILESWFNQLQQ